LFELVFDKVCLPQSEVAAACANADERFSLHG
jgi:hypothetical protein